MVQDIANIADRVQERDILLHVGHLDHCMCRLTASSTVVFYIFSGEGKKYVSKLGNVGQGYPDQHIRIQVAWVPKGA